MRKSHELWISVELLEEFFQQGASRPAYAVKAGTAKEAHIVGIRMEPAVHSVVLEYDRPVDEPLFETTRIAVDGPPPNYMYGWHFLRRLQAAGLIGKGIQRVVIDCKQDDYAVMYVQKALTGTELDVVLGEPGLKILTKELS